MKKFLLSLVLLLVSAAFVSAQSGLSATDIQSQIESLMKQIEVLQKKLAEAQAQQQANPPFCYNFSQDLMYGYSKEGVINLHIALERSGFKISGEEKEKGFFGDSTASAVVGFQEKYKKEILTPAGLKRGTGYVGPATRAQLNRLYHCVGENAPNPGQPWITVLSPNGGENLSFGNLNVKWNATNISGKVIVYLQFADDSLCKIGSSDAKKGEDLFSVVEGDKCDSTHSIINGKYKVAIFADQKDPPRDYSDDSFIILGPRGNINPSLPSVTVVSPNGGEIFKTGNKYMIKWSSVNIPSTQNVRITLRYVQNDPTYPGGKNIEEWIAAETPNNGSYEWKVPEVYGLGMDESAFRVKVDEIANQPTYSDYSDNTFTIKLGESNPNLKITSPVVGTNYVTGQIVFIEWTPVYAGGTVRFTLLRKNDKSFSRWINTYYSNDKKWAWTVPVELSGNDYFVRVEHSSDGVSRDLGYSGVFSINSSDSSDSKLSVTASRLGDVSGRAVKDKDDIAALKFTAGAQKAVVRSVTLHFKGGTLANSALPKSIRLVNVKSGDHWADSLSKSCTSDGEKSCSVKISLDGASVAANTSKVINIRIDSTKLFTTSGADSFSVSMTAATDLVWTEDGVEMNLGTVPFEIASVSY